MQQTGGGGGGELNKGEDDLSEAFGGFPLSVFLLLSDSCERDTNSTEIHV